MIRLTGMMIISMMLGELFSPEAAITNTHIPREAGMSGIRISQGIDSPQDSPFSEFAEEVRHFNSGEGSIEPLVSAFSTRRFDGLLQ